jgi:glycosyltransferase involved in cell wall biosynthesis
MDIYNISVVIPTYNRSELLDYTLSSILNQKFIGSFEVIVVDDGSIDNTSSIVDTYREKLDIKYYYQEDRGYRVASARNIGINNAKGEIIVFVDSGILLTDGCLSGYFLRFKGEINKVVLGYMFGLEGKDAVSIMPSEIDLQYLTNTTEKFISNRKFLDIREEVFFDCGDDLNLLSAPWAISWTGNLAIPRKWLVDGNGFDTNYDGRWGMEDIDLGYRLFKKGLGFELARECSAIHYPHENDVESKFREEEVNKKYFAKKFNDDCSKLFLSIDHSLNFNRTYRIKQM